MRYFCTYFDRNYLVRGLALYRSLVRHAGPFRMWVLCFDDFTYNSLLRLQIDNLIPISLESFEHGDNALLSAKEDRTLIEYYFTCSPSLIQYVLKQNPEIDALCYLDADLFFYSDPSPIYKELGEQSILIIPHRFPVDATWRGEDYGTYNVGLLAFSNDRFAHECLQWWRERCVEWCFDRCEPGRFADQKYLDDWPERFERVVVSQHKGANLAPWNWMNYDIQISNGTASVDGEPLIFYHFHGVKILGRRLYDTASSGEYKTMPPALRNWFYPPYVAELKRTEDWLRKQIPAVCLGYSSIRTASYGWRGVVSKLLNGQIMIDFKNR